MKNIIFITGGCKSGKSSFALDYANRRFRKKAFLATSRVLDREMEERVKRHVRERDPDWITVEEPEKVSGALRSLSPEIEVVLIDCITMWVNNLLMKEGTAENIMELTENLMESMEQIPQSVLVVSNEVGAGIVPENQLARSFRDLVGLVNQQIAARSSTVVLTIAGIPHAIKGSLS